MWALDGQRFWRLVARMPFYPGVLHARAMVEAAKAGPLALGGGGASPATMVTPDVITRESVAADPLLSDLISFG